MAVEKNKSSSSSVVKSIRDFRLKGKAVLLRLDLNVPLAREVVAGLGEAQEAGQAEDGVRGGGVRVRITDDTRIREALPTIRFALEQEARLVIIAHLGRPEGKRMAEFSLEPIAEHLALLLHQDVTLAEDCGGEGIGLMVQGLKNGQILMLENLRFHPEEELNDPEFSKQLVSLAQIYINDAFGAAHRKHSSTYGVPSLLLERGIGLLIEKELRYLAPLLSKPARPFYAVLGGSKVHDKIKTIESLLRKVDGLLVGGAMAHAFMMAEGRSLPQGAAQPRVSDLEAARLILKEAKRREVEVILPEDSHDGYDLGKQSILKFIEVLSSAGTVFWNGPVGMFENPLYAAGTFQLAAALAQQKGVVKIVGGGDTVAAVVQSGWAEHFQHLSTGGGAVLEYLENGSLPGLEVLKLTPRECALLEKSLSLGEPPVEGDDSLVGGSPRMGVVRS